jgi:hypothetical protein
MPSATLCPQPHTYADTLNLPSIAFVFICEWRLIPSRAHSPSNLKLLSPSVFPHIQSLEGYLLSPKEREALSAQLAGVARSRLDGHVREAALTRMSRMKDK